MRIKQRTRIIWTMPKTHDEGAGEEEEEDEEDNKGSTVALHLDLHSVCFALFCGGFVILVYSFREGLYYLCIVEWSVYTICIYSAFIEGSCSLVYAFALLHGGFILFVHGIYLLCFD